jgi:uncharacterized membrane protein
VAGSHSQPFDSVSLLYNGFSKEIDANEKDNILHNHLFIEYLFLTGFFLVVVSLLINRHLFRSHISLARKIRGTQIFIGIGMLFSHGFLFMGWWNAIIFILVSLSIGTVFEFIGIKKGWWFGCYSYTDKAGPNIGGLAIAVPLIWCILIYMGIWQAKLIITGLSLNHSLFLILFTAFFVTLFDLVGDPVAVDEGLWIWGKKGRYSGIPFTNFISWFVTAILIMLVFITLSHKPLFRDDSINWTTYLPAFGFCFMTGISARVCFERKLRLPGIIGLIITVVCLLVNIIIIFHIL